MMFGKNFKIDSMKNETILINDWMQFMRISFNYM